MRGVGRREKARSGGCQFDFGYAEGRGEEGGGGGDEEGKGSEERLRGKRMAQRRGRCRWCGEDERGKEEEKSG